MESPAASACSAAYRSSASSKHFSSASSSARSVRQIVPSPGEMPKSPVPTLIPEETRLVVSVPDAEMLYDRLEVTGKVENRDFWGLSTQDRYQSMLNDQQAACRKAYLEDQECMEQAWKSSCEQLKGLFLQWTGESLRLEFVHADGASAGQQ